MVTEPEASTPLIIVYPFEAEQPKREKIKWVVV
jgi:hypothetical protein